MQRIITIGLLLLLPVLQAQAELRVAVTIKPIHSIVSALMQGVDAPELLIDGGQNPYDFRLPPAKQEQLAAMDLLIWVGPELESSLVEGIANLPQRVQVIELLSSSHFKILLSRTDDQRRDPYFWLDSRNTIMLADDLVKVLKDLDPQRTHLYVRNYRNLMKKLERIDREYEYGYRGLKAGLGLQYHDTLQYFEQAYALSVLDRVTERPGQTDDAARLLAVRQRILDGDASCVLIESGLSASNLDLLTQGTAARVGWLDSLGSKLAPGPDLYFQLMRYNTRVIKGCLQGGAEGEQAADEQIALPDGTKSSRFMLTDHMGRVISNSDLLGKYHLLYFGYTFCPDICPTSLAVMSRAFEMLGEKADQIQPYFITIDPERDTVEIMRKYVTYFDPRLIGITGNAKMIEGLAANYRVKYEKVVEEGKDPDMYLMDHSASLYLLDPEGRFITKYVHGIGPQQLHDELLKIIP